MYSRPDCRLLDLLGLEIPVIQTPMAGADSVALARSVAIAGALGSLACAILTPADVFGAAHALREGINRPINLNFFCQAMAPPSMSAEEE